MELYKVTIKTVLILAVPDGEEPSDENIVEAFEGEVFNGLSPGEMKRTRIIKKKQIPDNWRDSLPWSFPDDLYRKGYRKDHTVLQILKKNK